MIGKVKTTIIFTHRFQKAVTPSSFSPNLSMVILDVVREVGWPVLVRVFAWVACWRVGVRGVGDSGGPGLAGPVSGVVGRLHHGPLAVGGRAGVTAGWVAADLLGSGGGASSQSTGRCQRCVERFQLSVVRIVKKRNWRNFRIIALGTGYYFSWASKIC